MLKWPLSKTHQWSGLGLKPNQEEESPTTVIAKTLSSMFENASTTAFPRLIALLGDFPVVGLRDGAVLVICVGGGVKAYSFFQSAPAVI